MKTTLLALLLLPLAAHATPDPNVDCQLNYEGSPVTEFFFPYEAVGASCEFAQDFINVLKSTAKWPSVKATVKLLGQSQGDGASFDGGRRVITTPFSLVRRIGHHNPYQYRPRGTGGGWGGSSDPMDDGLYRIPRHLGFHVLSHEFGHAIFEQAACEKIPAYKFICEARVRASDAKMAQLKAGNHSYERDPEYRRNVDSIKGNPEQHRLMYMVGGYSEFIADVVAVYEADYKEAISKSITHPEASDEELTRISYRSFAANHSVKGWVETESHGLLGPTRTYVGKRLWPKTTEQKTRYLDLLIAASIEEIKARIAANEIGLAPSIVNQRLIARLRSLRHSGQPHQNPNTLSKR